MGSRLRSLQTHRPGTHGPRSAQDECPRPWCPSSDLEAAWGRPALPSLLGPGEESRRDGARAWELAGSRLPWSPPRLTRITVITGVRETHSSPVQPVRPLLCHRHVEVRRGREGNVPYGGPEARRETGAPGTQVRWKRIVAAGRVWKEARGLRVIGQGSRRCWH